MGSSHNRALHKCSLILLGTNDISTRRLRLLVLGCVTCKLLGLMVAFLNAMRQIQGSKTLIRRAAADYVLCRVCLFICALTFSKHNILKTDLWIFAKFIADTTHYIGILPWKRFTFDADYIRWLRMNGSEFTIIVPIIL